MIIPPHVAPEPQTRLHYVCYRAPEREKTGGKDWLPSLDGRLDKPFWAGAAWTEEFVDIEGPPPPKPLPRLRTRAKLLWDDQYLYIGAEMEEPHIWATLTERDSIVFHDNDFEVFVNPTGDNHNYYELEINALGTIFDLFLPKPYRDGGPADHGWDVKGLISAVHIDGTLNDPRDKDKGWTVEIAMPWSAFDRHGGIKSPPKDGDQWRLNFSRVQWDLDVAEGKYRKVPDRPEHNWVWSPQGIVDMHRPEQWGYVQFSSVVAGKGTAPFVADPSMPARDHLHRIYYAQRVYQNVHGQWATGLADLHSIDSTLLFPSPPLVGKPEFSLTREGWEATQAIRLPSGAVQKWSIRQDSLVTLSP